MRFLSSVSRLGRKLLGNYRFDQPHSSIERLRICRLEEMEPRQYLTANIHLGAAFYEDASGNDAGTGDLLEVTFQGRAAGTQLTHIHISGDKDGKGLSSGDIFFDTAPGGLGSFGSAPLSVVSHDGFQVLSATTVDGSTELDVTLSGFVAGDKLILSVDADEAQYVDLSTNSIDTNAIVEGGEFQRSHLVGDFVAPHFNDITGSALYWDAYDANFAAADQSSGTHLNLPNDHWDPTQDLSDRTAGAVTVIQQIPLPISLSGTVYVDANVNNHLDAGEKGIAGVSLDLQTFDGTQYVTTGKKVTTDANGNYKFDGLLSDNYRVVETQPSGYFSIGATAGTVNGATRGVVTTPDILSQIELQGGEDSLHNNFGEALPNSITGHVLVDLNGDCTQQPGEILLSGVTIHLLDASGKIIQTTTTDATGNYFFNNLAPGTYGVEKVQPAGYFEVASHIGSAGGKIIDRNEVDDIELGSGVDATGYNYCIMPPASLSGRVRVDANDNSALDASDPPIVGVTLNLLDPSGNVVGTTQTDGNGNYEFTSLMPGTYSVQEEQPAGYFQGAVLPGTAGGVVSQTDVISQVALAPDVNAVHYDFLELLPNSIGGHVLVDLNGDCTQQPGEILLSGVTIHLLDAAGIIIDTTVTDETGNYLFSNLAPGTYGVEKVQPAGYFEVASHIGSAGGKIIDRNEVDDIELGSGVDATGYNYCIMPPAELCGVVYSDLNNNGVLDEGEQGIAGVQLNLLDADGKPTGVTTTTDANGEYCFSNLKPGTYGVSEVQPPGYFDGIDQPGDAGGIAINPGDQITGAVLTPNMDADHYNFGELLPASIAGHVMVDTNGDCDTETGGLSLAGVTIHLLDASGNIVGDATTDAAGNYIFVNLAPGTYGVEKVLPAGYFEDDNHVGSAGGEIVDQDLIVDIGLDPSVDATGYNFCVAPPAMLSGIVFQDGPPIALFPGQVLDVTAVRDGIYEPGDPLLAGVTMELVDGVTGLPIYGSSALPGRYASDSPITTVTDQNGRYVFDGLAPGNYGVFEVKPAGYLDGINTPGSLGGIAFTPNQAVSEVYLEALADGVTPDNNAIIRIALPSGQQSVENNFSLVKTITPGYLNPPPKPEPPLIHPEFIVLPPPPLPSLPTSPLPYQPNPRYYGSDLVDYTWHLSVINAGQPRDSEVTQSTVQLTSVSEEEVAAWQKVLGESEWILYTRGDNGQATERHVLFGMKGGRPVTGDFNGDGITDVGVFKDGQWFIDLNGNGAWDESDLWAKLGTGADKPVTGDWDGDGKTDIGIYGPAWAGDPRAVQEEPGIPDSHNWHTDVHKNIPRPPQKTPLGKRSMKRTAKGSIRTDVIDHVFHYGTPGDVPVTGDWNGDGLHTIGIFHDGNWYLDLNGDGKWTEKDGVIHFGQKGDIPVVGNFNGDGMTDIGVYRNGVFYLDTNGNHVLDDEDEVIELGQPGDLPVVGDWDGTGRDHPGIYRDGGGTRAVNSGGAGAAPAPSTSR